MGRSGKGKSRGAAANTLEISHQVLDSFLPPGISSKKKSNKSLLEKKPSSYASASFTPIAEKTEIFSEDLDKLKDLDSNEFVFVDSSAVKEENEERDVLVDESEVLNSFTRQSVVEKVDCDHLGIVEPATVQSVQALERETEESLKELNQEEPLVEKNQVEELEKINDNQQIEENLKFEQDLGAQITRADAISLENLSLNDLEPENPVKVSVDEENYIFQGTAEDSLNPPLLDPSPILTQQQPRKEIPLHLNDDNDEIPRKRSWFFCCA
jgi:hypothetical protein